MLIYLLRHGHTDGSGTYTGISDVDLNSVGRTEVRMLADLVRGIAPGHCFCSPLRRCRETAALLKITCGITYDECLREIDFGRWEGLSFKHITQSDQKSLNRWREQGEHFTFPGGEKVLDFSHRVETWFNLLQKNDSNRILVISHAGVIRQGLCYLLGLPRSALFNFDIRQAALSLIECDNGFNQLKFLNNRGA